jgi:hypothetical protein
MKKVRLITTDDNNGKIAISRTPIRNRFFFDGEWHGINVTTKPEIIKDASILETTHAIYSDLTETFNISHLISKVELEMFDTKRQPRPATIDRRLRDLKETNLINYEVVNSAKGIYKKLPVISKTCDQQVKIEFKPDIKKRFVEFLKAEGAYEKFEKNKETMPIFRTALENGGNLLESQFLWANSPEGFTYWLDLDVKWIELCK